jgi:hypothetical protein
MQSNREGPDRTTAALLAAVLVYVAAFVALDRVIQKPGLGWAPGVQLVPRSSAAGSRLTVPPRETIYRRRGPTITAADAILLANLVVACSAYLALLYLLRRREPSRHEVALVAGGVLAAVGAMFLLPRLLSNDVYSYVLQGRILHLWRGNPAIDPPYQYVNDPFLSWTDPRWSAVPAVYGAAWLRLSAAVTWVAEQLGGGLVTYLLAYKVVAAAFHLGSCWLIWKILGSVAPDRRVWGTFLYGGNPLPLIEFAGSGHNDAALVFLLLLGVWLHLRDRRWLALTSFTMAMLVKWTGAAAVALYIVLMLRSLPSRRAVATTLVRATALVGLICILLYAPLWSAEAVGVLRRAPSQTRLSNSLGSLVAELLSTKYDGDAGRVVIIAPAVRWAVTLAGNLVTVGAALIAVTVVADATTALAACAWLLFVYCTLGTSWFWPWYVTWFLALAALLDWRTTGRSAVTFSCLALAVYPFKLAPWRSLVVMGPALLVAGALAIRATASRRRTANAPGAAT